MIIIYATWPKQYINICSYIIDDVFRFPDNLTTSQLTVFIFFLNLNADRLWDAATVR